MSLVASCYCGKKLRIPDQHAGKRVKCPGCGTVLTAPTASEAEEELPRRPARASAPARRPAPPPTELEPHDDEPIPRRTRPEVDDEEEYEDPAPRKKKSKKKGTGLALPLAIAGSVLLVLVAGGVGAFIYFRGGAMPADLTYVPEDAQGFVTMRVGELWKSPVTQAVLQQMPRGMGDPNSELQKALGISVADIDRLTVVFQDVEREQFWMVLSTLKPVERSRVVTTLGGSLQESQHQGKSYFPSGGLGKPDVHFVNDRLFVLAQGQSMKTCLEKTPRKGGKGAMTKLLNSVSLNAHLVAGGVIPPDKAQRARAQMQGMAAPFLPLVEAQTLLLTANIGETSDLAVNMVFPDDAKTKAAKDAVNNGLGMAKGMIAMAKGAQPATTPADQKQAMADAETALNNIKIDQSGNELRLSLQTKVDMKKLATAVPNPFIEPSLPKSVEKTPLGPGARQQTFPKGALPGEPPNGPADGDVKPGRTTKTKRRGNFPSRPAAQPEPGKQPN